jgi:hypothetical protein
VVSQLLLLKKKGGRNATILLLTRVISAESETQQAFGAADSTLYTLAEGRRSCAVWLGALSICEAAVADASGVGIRIVRRGRSAITRVPTREGRSDAVVTQRHYTISEPRIAFAVTAKQDCNKSGGSSLWYEVNPMLQCCPTLLPNQVAADPLASKLAQDPSR